MKGVVSISGCPEDSDLVASVGSPSLQEFESRWVQPSPVDPVANTFTIDASSLASFVRVKGNFTASAFSAEALVLVDVAVVVSSPSPIEFSQLKVGFSDSAYDAFCVLDADVDHRRIPADAAIADENDDDAGVETDAASPSLLLEPGVVRAFRFHFSPRPEDVGSALRISSISLRLGDPAKRCSVLTWNEGGGDVMSSTTTPSLQAASAAAPEESAGPSAPGGGGGEHVFWQRPPPKRKLLPEEEWRFIPGGPTTAKMESRPPRVVVNVDHAPPALVNEFYAVNVVVNNEEDVIVTDVTLSLDLIHSNSAEEQQQQQQTTLEASTQFFLELPTPDELSSSSTAVATQPRVVDVPMPDLEAGQSCVKTIYVKCLQSGDRRFAVFVNYAIEAKTGKPASPSAPLHASSNVVPANIVADPAAAAAAADGDPPRRRCLCLASVEWEMRSIRPFQVVTNPLTTKFEATEVVFDKEPFLFTCDVTSISEWPIEIKTTHLEISENIRLPEGKEKGGGA